jgi:hypothetical protein
MSGVRKAARQDMRHPMTVIFPIINPPGPHAPQVPFLRPPRSSIVLSGCARSRAQNAEGSVCCDGTNAAISRFPALLDRRDDRRQTTPAVQSGLHPRRNSFKLQAARSSLSVN